MSKPNTPIYVVLSTGNLTQSQVAEINALTRELGKELESEFETQTSISYVDQKNLPENAKVADLLIYAGQLAIEIAPVVLKHVTPWVLSKIDNAIKAFSSRGKPIAAKVIIDNREIPITPKTTAKELDSASKRIEVYSESPGSRLALLIGNSDYQDKSLPRLNSPAVDVDRLAKVLKDPNTGAFDQVDVLINKTNGEIEQSIENFFANKKRDDLLLLYYSGHGIKSAQGQLFLTAQNTTSTHRRASSITDSFLKEVMNESDSQRQILILDCCFGGTLVEGAKSNNIIGQSAGSILPFQQTGYGRIIITASDSMQYATDGKHIDGDIQSSMFTHHLVRGLETGEADSDNDGVIDIVELYYYAHGKVVPKQNPKISTTSHEGRIILGINPVHKIQPATLPEDIRRAMQSEEQPTRLGSVRLLEKYLVARPNDRSAQEAVKIALTELMDDDRRSVSEFAGDVYSRYFESPKPRDLPPPDRPEPKDVPAAAPKSVPIPHTGSVDYPTSRPLAAKPKNEILGGVFNCILPGLGHVYAENFPRAALTFILYGAGIFLAAILAYGLLSDSGSVCFFPLVLLSYVFLFIDGMTSVRKSNKKLELKK